jgi:hypothetical protein
MTYCKLEVFVGAYDYDIFQELKDKVIPCLFSVEQPGYICALGKTEENTQAGRDIIIECYMALVKN